MKRFRDFSIRTKFILAFIIDGILVVMLGLTIFYSSAIIGLGKVENYHLENEIRRAQSGIDSELDNLSRNVKDYAFWDDMYNYVNTRDEKWVRLNVTEWIPKNFGIDLILIYAAEKLIYQYGNFAEFQIREDLSRRPLIKKAVELREVKGLYPASKGVMLVSSSQIIHTDESGPRNGTYIYGKFINLKKIKTTSEIELSVIINNEVADSTIVGYIDRPKNFADIYNELADKKFPYFNIYKPNYQSAFVYALLKDIEGKNMGMLELVRPRRAIVFMKTVFIKISIFILILTTLTVFITVLKITGFILKPMSVLKKTIDEIQKTKDMLRRAKVESGDEIGFLAKDFNLMMDALNNSQKELTEAHQSLMQSEKMATAAELAMGAVHQINNPLSIAIGRVQMLRRLVSYKTPIPGADLEKGLNIIEENTKRAIDITNSLLHYASHVALKFERCDINEVLGDAIDLLRPSLEAENINIVENLKEDLPFVQYCDEQQMKDVFMNIIINAQQAVGGGGRLEISTEYDAKEDMVWIKFKDNGCGIPLADIKKLFIPFFSTKPDRTGLGLAISYNMVKGHRGKIEVTSEVGRGSTFTVKLPVGGGVKI